MLAAFGLHRTLPQEVAALLELREKLVVEVVAVGDHDNGRTLNRLMEKMGVKHHRERFARSLRVPEYARLLRALGDGLARRFNGLANGVVLVIAGKDLVRARAGLDKTDKVLENVEEPRRLKDALEEHAKLRKALHLALSVRGLPFHEAVFAAGNRPNTGIHLIGNHADLVEDERLRDVLHVISEL